MPDNDGPCERSRAIVGYQAIEGGMFDIHTPDSDEFFGRRARHRGADKEKFGENDQSLPGWERLNEIIAQSLTGVWPTRRRPGQLPLPAAARCDRTIPISLRSKTPVISACNCCTSRARPIRRVRSNF